MRLHSFYFEPLLGVDFGFALAAMMVHWKQNCVLEALLALI
ncbi:hypothetical protein AALB_0170 [Agarivorans albus MKT 106]|uniref:Uncharacterized protein n=1 Tax=Agarivorans albus MKT 106 TaxID=1331007 RepID=R9PFD2_AGAAL|nr:hypothetical protein AALB_0170 [Agarivorans albus MKT 106]